MKNSEKIVTGYYVSIYTNFDTGYTSVPNWDKGFRKMVCDVKGRKYLAPYANIVELIWASDLLFICLFFDDANVIFLFWCQLNRGFISVKFFERERLAQ